ncbi:hypothetical protein PO909_006515, partial [Leuciscus waleckii]
VCFILAACNSLSAADVDAACASCSALTKHHTQISNGCPPSPKELDVELLSYYKLHLEQSVKDNFLFRGSRLIAPAALWSVLVAFMISIGGQGWMLKFLMLYVPSTCVSSMTQRQVTSCSSPAGSHNVTMNSVDLFLSSVFS